MFSYARQIQYTRLRVCVCTCGCYKTTARTMENCFPASALKLRTRLQLLLLLFNIKRFNYNDFRKSCECDLNTVFYPSECVLVFAARNMLWNVWTLYHNNVLRNLYLYYVRIRARRVRQRRTFKGSPIAITSHMWHNTRNGNSTRNPVQIRTSKERNYPNRY